MTNEEKALKACRDYARLSEEIRQLSREIGKSLMKCKGVETEPDADDPLQCTTTEPHLKRLYRGELVVGDYFAHPGIRFLSEREIRERLITECGHCLAAHHAIQMRKARRRSLGAAKRFITILGRRPA